MTRRTFVLLLLCSPLPLVFGCDLRYGFVESVFQLASDSRLPKALILPPGIARHDVTVTIRFYTHPFLKNKVRMVVFGPPPERKTLMDKVGTNRWHPYTEKEFKARQSYAVYPNYSIMTLDGIEDVFEQREKGNVLYVTDDPRLTQSLTQH